jgi:hypothetical protein
VGCGAAPAPYDATAEAYLDDPGTRVAILAADLVSLDNQYAAQRLEHVGADWDALPIWDPATVAVTPAMAAAARAGEPLVWSSSDGGSVAPAERPTTDAEWIALGRRAFFEYPLRADTALVELLASEGGPDAVGFLREGGAWLGLRAWQDDDGVALGATCAQCHMGPDPDGRLTGRRSNRAMNVGAIRLLVADEPTEDELENTTWADLHALGPGRTDVLPDPVFNPYAFPDLGGLADMPYLHHTANWRHRGTSTLALRVETLMITSRYGMARPPRELAWAIAMWIRSLEPLPPSEPAPEGGAEVFEAAGCAGCHVPPLYTSERLVEVAVIGTDGAAGDSQARGTGYYRIPSLRGVAYTAPYLHHGAFDSLDAMFDPARSEPGHRWGLDLDGADRDALLAFLHSI